MRQASLLGGLVMLLLTSGRLSAVDSPPDVRTVIVPRAQVWCGPSTSDGLYPTNELRQGDRVQVVQEESEWLAIRPPAGSFSWINERFVKRMFPSYPATYVVTYSDHPAPVLIGSSLKRDRPTKMGAKLERGTQVRLVGRVMTDSEGTWLPIESPEGELRYIRKEDVSRPATVVASAASVRKTAVEPPPPPDGDVLWRDAELAERKGRIADAIRLYRQAGDANLSVNPARAEAAYQRAHWLEQAGANPSGGSLFAPDRGTPASLVPANQSGTNAVRLIGTTGSGPANGQLVSAQAVSPGWGTQQSNDYRRGRLQFAHKHNENGRYHLMDARGQPILMVVAGPGVDLSSHVDRTVELWGYSAYVPDLRKYLMTVTSVRDAQ
jgi:hypothetical protein